jgi:hypothetical protein
VATLDTSAVAKLLVELGRHTALEHSRIGWNR